MHILLQWDESWRVGGTNTGPSVFDGFVSDTEFTQVVSNHFRLQRRKSNVSKVKVEWSKRLNFEKTLSASYLTRIWVFSKPAIRLRKNSYMNDFHSYVMCTSLNHLLNYFIGF